MGLFVAPAIWQGHFSIVAAVQWYAKSHRRCGSMDESLSVVCVDGCGDASVQLLKELVAVAQPSSLGTVFLVGVVHFLVRTSG